MSKPGQNAPAPDQMKAFAEADWDGPLWMINMLKFKGQADYGNADEPARTGKEAYTHYGSLAGPFVEAVGGKPVTMLFPKHILIGDKAEDWDELLVVEYPSREAFLSMINDPAYQATAHHRTAALERSALIASKKVL
ncbi:MAG: DUF1330 domain-containing protein [Alphaproteobacteria bacterium]